MSLPIIEDFTDRYLSPVLMNNYGQNVLGSTYNSVEFVYQGVIPGYENVGALKCQIKQPFSATCNINPADLDSHQILQIRKSCPRQGHTKDVDGNLYLP